MVSPLTDDSTRVAFLSRMISATEAGSVNWMTVEGRPYWFVTDVLPFSYVIHSVDGDDQPPFELKIFKYFPDEDPVRGTSNEIETWTWDRFLMTTLNDYLLDLYKAANRQTKGVGDLAKEMFQALATLDGGSPEPQRVEIVESPTTDIDEVPF